jgi:hypothetical protein
MEPHLIQMIGGGWLAVTGPNAIAPIGVFGSSRSEAEERLHAAEEARAAMRATAR